MGNYLEKIFTPGEKIRNLRNKLNITQSDLGDKFSKSYISRLEHDMIRLNLDAAQEIAVVLNTIAQNKNIDIKVTSECLMESRNEQISVTLKKYLKELNGADNAEEFKVLLSNVELFLKEYTYQEGYHLQLEIFKLAVERFLKNGEYSNCIANIFKCIHLATMLGNYNFIAELFLTITRVYSFSKDYEAIVTLGNYIIGTGHGSEETIKKIKFNLALAYRELDNQKECIELLGDIRQNYKTTDSEKNDINILLSNCHKSIDLESRK